MQTGFLPYICSNPPIKYFSLSHFKANHHIQS